MSDSAEEIKIKFDIEIIKIKLTLAPVIRQAIDRTPCFGVEWWDDQDHTICPFVECKIRKECEIVWTNVDESSTKEIIEEDLLRDLSVKINAYKYEKPKRRPGYGKYRPKKEKKKKVCKYIGLIGLKGKGQYPYYNLGRPVDLFADYLWTKLKTPPELPLSWHYGKTNTEENLELAKKNFILNFGPDLMVSKRISIHKYFFNGVHLFQFAMQAINTGWLFVNFDIANIIKKFFFAKLDLLKIKKRNKIDQTRYRHLPCRIFIFKTDQIDVVIEALKKYKGLEYL